MRHQNPIVIPGTSAPTTATSGNIYAIYGEGRAQHEPAARAGADTQRLEDFEDQDDTQLDAQFVVRPAAFIS
ncbi:MAG: hypothetical protein ABSF15_23630 [Candidatus Sulfotelmatobacter sp.]|jgi:hypothetical protein